MSTDVLRQICVQAEEPVVVTDAAGRVIEINDPFFRMCGHTSEALQGQRPGDVLQGEDTDPQTRRLLHQAVAAGVPVACDILNYHADGHPYWVHLSITPIRGVNGEVERFIAFEREIVGPRDGSRLQAVCMYCKAFEAARGEWLQFEEFHRRYLGRGLTHGVCPGCEAVWT